MWLFFRCINRCVVSIHSASRSTDRLYWMFLQLLEARQCASWGWGGSLEVRRRTPDVWGGRQHKMAGVWMDCVTSVLSQPGAHQALCNGAVTWEAILKYRVAHHRHLQKQTLHGAVGFWASRELPVCCVGRLCFVHSCGVIVFVLIKLFLWINNIFLANVPFLKKFIHVVDDIINMNIYI